MTDSLPGVVVSYDRFLEFQHRRRQLAADSVARDRARTIDADAVPMPAPAADGTSPDARRTP